MIWFPETFLKKWSNEHNKSIPEIQVAVPFYFQRCTATDERGCLVSFMICSPGFKSENPNPSELKVWQTDLSMCKLYQAFISNLFSYQFPSCFFGLTFKIRKKGFIEPLDIKTPQVLGTFYLLKMKNKYLEKTLTS